MIEQALSLLSTGSNVAVIVIAVMVFRMEMRFQRIEVHTGLRNIKDIG